MTARQALFEATSLHANWTATEISVRLQGWTLRVTHIRYIFRWLISNTKQYVILSFRFFSARILEFHSTIFFRMTGNKLIVEYNFSMFCSENRMPCHGMTHHCSNATNCAIIASYSIDCTIFVKIMRILILVGCFRIRISKSIMQSVVPSFFD